MTFDGPSGAFIIMSYIVQLMILTLTLLGAQQWLQTKHTFAGILWGIGPLKITLFGYGLIFFTGGLVASLLALFNVMIGAEKHTLDGSILSLVVFLHIYPLITLAWWNSRGRRLIPSPPVTAGAEGGGVS
jgi:hypothetical protein